MSAKSIACLHTVPAVCAFVAEKLEEQIKDLDITVQHSVYPEFLDSLTAEESQLGVLYKKFSDQIVDLLTSHDAVLVTCSSLGEFADKFKEKHSACLFRIDEPMMHEAVQLGQKIGLAVTNKTTISPSAALLRKAGDEIGIEVAITCVPCLDEVSQLSSMESSSKISAIQYQLAELFSPFDVVVLAQVSIAQVFEAANLSFSTPVLKSYQSGIERVINCFRLNQL